MFYMQVLHHGQSMRGESHRFSVTVDPEDAFSRVSVVRELREADLSGVFHLRKT